MATVWAKSNNGVWSNAALWAFWNENTQQIEDYGQVPQVDDIVYLNGYVVQVSVATYTYLQVAEIHNDLNPYTTRIGGYIDLLNNIDNNQQISIVAHFIGRGSASGDMILRQGIDGDYARRNVNITIVGDVDNCYIFQNNRAVNNSVITGNVNSSVWYFEQEGGAGVTKTLTITGNVSGSLLSATARMAVASLTISGDVVASLSTLVSGAQSRTCNIYGNIKFTSINNFSHNININGIADMSELSTDENLLMPFSSGYGLIKRTNLTLIAPHLTDYPAETDVKKDISYAFNQMVGTYDINQYLPPESVVLKDYEYGDSDDRKTGTMENEVIVEVDNTNTINVYPYKRRNNG